MRLLLSWLLMLALSVAVVACGDDSDSDSDAAVDEGDEHAEEDELPDVDCSGDVPGYADVAAFEVCNNCHSSELSGAQRNNAPDDDNFDTYEGAEEGAMEIVEEVYEGKMPPPGTFTLTEAEKEELYKWALCGAME